MAVVLRIAILGLLVFYVWHRLVRRTWLEGGAKITRVILRSASAEPPAPR